MLCKTAFRQDITKIVIYLIFLNKIGVTFYYSLLSKKVYKHIESEILCRYSSMVTIKKSTLRLYRTTTFLAQL